MSLSQSVRAEPVEALYLGFGQEEGEGFDKLSPNGVCRVPYGGCVA
jgi:hypothetical protein